MCKCTERGSYQGKNSTEEIQYFTFYKKKSPVLHVQCTMEFFSNKLNWIGAQCYFHTFSRGFPDQSHSDGLPPQYIASISA